MGHPFKHFKTVYTHRKEVRKLCFKCGIPWRGITHDLSKYSPAEFIPGAKYWVGTMSPQVLERKEEGYSLAWMHHKGRNKHHFEYWIDYISPTGATPIEMPKMYLVEMFCDRVAACKIYQGEKYKDSSALEYFTRCRSHYFINENTARDLGMLLTMLADKGETETTRYIRQEFLGK